MHVQPKRIPHYGVPQAVGRLPGPSGESELPSCHARRLDEGSVRPTVSAKRASRWLRATTVGHSQCSTRSGAENGMNEIFVSTMEER